jgi:acyl-CoA reductase-like NAD-dependent aldehyde dehydrogenase
MNTDINTIYIGGEWVTPLSTNKIEIQSPATGEPVGSVIAADERDVDRAVAAARAAFDDPGGWSN